MKETAGCTIMDTVKNHIEWSNLSNGMCSTIGTKETAVMIVMETVKDLI